MARAGSFRAILFDVDGVLVDSPHERAWRRALEDLMAGEWAARAAGTTWASGAFTPRVYQREVSGKPRADGARAGLAHFGLPVDDASVARYAARKQDLVVELIEAGEFRAHDDAVRFLVAAHARGLLIATASSSQNARRMLERVPLPAGAPGRVLADLLDADLSGERVAHGKPAPDIFLAAAAALHVAPRDAVVVEDAVAGIIAAKAGAMAALATARADDAHLLEAAGADLVVRSLDDVDVDGLLEGRLAVRAAR
jgi:beta-phosphoglucomutase-like phosphatase (HAD superfamily)